MENKTNARTEGNEAGANAKTDGEMMHKGNEYGLIVQPGTNFNNSAEITAPQSKTQDEAGIRILDVLTKSYRNILDAAAQDIVWTPAWINLDKTPIFSKGTINVIQGKAGVHKSRLAETFCALLLSPHREGDFLGFSRYNLGTGYYVGYVDTERNTQEHFPAAVQRIRERAGLDRKTDNGRFFPVSIKQIDRRERLAAVQQWINHIRGEMEKKGVQDWNLFVVLDVVTDCVASFNRDDETLALFDYLGNLCEHYGVSFLLVLHENPFTEKARGHTGTEAMNKADTQIQIGYDAAAPGEESDLIKVKFLKTRNAARPKPLYLQYSKEKNGLVAADPEAVKEHIESKKKNKDEGLLLDALMGAFDACEEMSQKQLVATLADAFGWSDNTIKSKLKSLVDRQTPIQNKEGKSCKLAKAENPGKASVYYLQPLEPANKEAGKEAGISPDEEPPF